MRLREFQELMERTYGERDRARGLAGTFMWLAEEVGELAAALREGNRQEIAEELGDCLAWLLSVANLAGVDAEQAVARYAGGCPYCGAVPCRCTSKR